MEITQFELNIFTARAQADKAISSLKGILSGILIDNKLNEKEIQELSLWCQHHNDLIYRNPFNEFMTIIKLAISNGLPANEAIEDLYWLTQKYESDNYYYNGVTADLQTLQGICHGIVSDGELNDTEIFQLHKWLDQNQHLNSYYPYDELRSMVLGIVSDHKITNEERLRLLAYFNQFVKLCYEPTDLKIKSDSAHIEVLGLCTSDPEVEFINKNFCVTGVLKRYERDSLFRHIVSLGGIQNDSISRKTDYLIVGDNGNPAWAFACYGRKIEKAIEMRKSGHRIMLIHEYDFADIIDDMI